MAAKPNWHASRWHVGPTVICADPHVEGAAPLTQAFPTLIAADMGDIEKGTTPGWCSASTRGACLHWRQAAQLARHIA